MPAGVIACSAPPSYLTVPYYELISRTNRIALAEVVKIDSVGEHQYEYQFELEERVKGNVDNSFSMTFENYPSPFVKKAPDKDFNQHRGGVFWDQNAARQINDTDCRMHPVFEKGSTYLLFLDKPYHWKSFEVIKSKEDLWLQTVKNVVHSNNESYRLTQTLFEYLSAKKSVGIYRVLGCGKERHYEKSCYKRIKLLQGDPAPLPKNPLIFNGEYYSMGPVKTEEVLIVNYHHVHKNNFYWAYAYPIKDGMVNFSLRRSQIRISGQQKIEVRKLENYFK